MNLVSSASIVCVILVSDFSLSSEPKTSLTIWLQNLLFLKYKKEWWILKYDTLYVCFIYTIYNLYEKLLNSRSTPNTPIDKQDSEVIVENKF